MAIGTSGTKRALGSEPVDMPNRWPRQFRRRPFNLSSAHAVAGWGQSLAAGAGNYCCVFQQKQFC
jgi:hypothetical protein